MARPDKAAAVAELTESFRESSAAVLTEYRGLTVAQLKELRRSLAGNATYAVVKNTLTKIAAREAGIETLEPMLQGPSAVAFVTGDPVIVAKGLRDFARTHPLLVIKGGVMEGKTLSADEVKKIADLESREVLLAKLAGALKALPTRAAGLFQAPLSQMARLAKALEEKKPADGAAAAPSETDSSTEADTTEAPVAEAASVEVEVEPTETPAEPAE